MKNKRGKILLPILITALIYLSCKKADNKNSSDKVKSIDQLSIAPVDTVGALNGDWVVNRTKADPDFLNPIYTRSAIGIYIEGYIFESLNNQDEVTYELSPCVARLPEISKDHLLYTYEINKNARFSDGIPLTGEDVIFTAKAIALSFSKSSEEIERVELVNGNPYLVRFVVSKPDYYRRSDFSLMRILPKHILDPDRLSDMIELGELKEEKSSNPAIKKLSDLMNRPEVSRDPAYLVGSGPYKLEKWELNQTISLIRNDNYWNRTSITSYPDKIIWKIINDNSAALIAAKNKEIDVLSIEPKFYYTELGNPVDFKLKTATVTSNSYQFISWNELNPLFKDSKVRLALAYLIDRKNIIAKVLYGQAIPVQSHIFVDRKNLNTDLPEIEFDPVKGRKLLEEAGWKDTDGDGILDKVIDGKKTDFKFTLLSSTSYDKQIMIVYAEELKKAGILMDLVMLEFAVYIKKIAEHEFDARYGMWTLGNSFLNPYPIFHSSQAEPGGRNTMSFINRESDSLLEQYQLEFDESKRIDIIKKWQKLIYDEQPYLFLWILKDIYIYDDRFNNTRWYNLVGSARFNEWWVPKEKQKYKQ